MSNGILDVKSGIKARLERIPGLRAVVFEPEDWRDFPVAVIRLEGRGGSRAEASGSRFEAEFVVTVMVGGAKRREAFAALDGYIAPDGDMSVEAALGDDPTLGGAAERAYLAGVKNIRVVRMGGGRYAGADFRIRVEKRRAHTPATPKAVSSDAPRNEKDGANVNYLDITGISSGRAAPAQIKIYDPSATWSGARKMWIGKRSGEGRADDLFFQGESGAAVQGGTIFDESGGIWSGGAQPLSSASGGQYARMAWTKAGRYTTRSEFTLCGYLRIGIAASALPRGRFRVLARARTETNNSALRTGKMGFAPGWSFGVKAKTPVESEVVFPEKAGEFRTLDLGELALPPTATPEGYSTAGLELRVYGALSGGGAGSNSGTHHFRWSVDYVLLLPIDEGEVAVSGVGSANRVLLDTLSESGAGVYLLDSSDAAQGPAEFTGAAFALGPEDTRIYVARDDVSDPSGVRFGVAAEWTPLAAGF